MTEQDAYEFLSSSTDFNTDNDIGHYMQSKVKFKQKYCNEKILEKYDKELTNVEPTRGRKPKVVLNNYRVYFNKSVNLDKLYTMNRDVEDILVGVARLNWYRSSGESTPLSVKKIIYLLQSLSCITVSSVSELLCLSDRQSRRYVQACGLVIFHLDRLDELPDQYVELEDD